MKFREHQQVGMKMLDRARVAIETLSTATQADEDKAVVGNMVQRLVHLVDAVLPHVLPLPESWKARIVSDDDPARDACAQGGIASSGSGDVGGADSKSDELENAVKELGDATVSLLQSESVIRVCVCVLCNVMRSRQRLAQCSDQRLHLNTWKHWCRSLVGSSPRFASAWRIGEISSLTICSQGAPAWIGTLHWCIKTSVISKTLFESQWSVLVEPYSKFARAADAQSGRKLVISFDGLQPWMSDFIHAWNVFIGSLRLLVAENV